jgi:DNA-binding CsgD family transcriptional regulator/tetratricopeptide (TPR) repeat protein
MRFNEIHDALVAAAGQDRLTIIIDDLHWADQSTLDLVLFLARRLRGGPIVLVAAYRSDELHRRHPLRPVVAELSRGYVRERIDLGPLDEAAVGAQIAELGGDTARNQVAAILERSDGNPFYVEELVALDPGARELPASVRDVLLARVAALDPATNRVLGACAVVGHEVDVDLLTKVLALEPLTIDAAIRDAVEHAILIPSDDGGAYRFRHALLEEATHDDLLPAERVDLHRRVAAALQSRLDAAPGSVPPGELARHLDLGGQSTAAVGAYLGAAELAFRALAWTEGIAAFERAAEIVAAGPRNHEIDRSLLELVEPVAQALNWTGSSGRSVALVRDWIAWGAAANDVPATVRLWMTLGRILNDMGDEPASRAAIQMAATLQPIDGSTPLGVDLLILLASDAWVPGRTREALRLAEQALEGAEQLRDPALLFRALVHRAEAAIGLGDLEVGYADVARARALQAEHGFLDTHGHLATNVGSGLADVGELDAALEIVEEGLRMGRELGIGRSWDPWNLSVRAYIAFLGGQWTAADGFVAEARTFRTPGMPTAYVESTAASLAIGRGEFEAVDRSIDAIDTNVKELIGDWHAVFALLRGERADAAGDQAAALNHAEAALLALEGLDTFPIRMRVTAAVAAAAADLVVSLHPRRDRDRILVAQGRASAVATLARELDSGRIIPGTRSTRGTAVMARLAAAEAARANGEDDLGVWAGVAEGFAQLGMSPRVAYARFRGAGAALRTGDREAAIGQLRAADTTARTIGMTVLLSRIEAFRRAARIELSSASRPLPVAPVPIDPWGLSSREREVLALVAAGRTNGQIGAALFISTKTASVHVTHILDKLGVSSRTEAALLANEAGLL